MGFCSWDGGVFGVGGGAEPDYSIAGFDVVEVSGAGLEDGAFCFAAEDFGLGRGVETGAEIARAFRQCPS